MAVVGLVPDFPVLDPVLVAVDGRGDIIDPARLALLVQRRQRIEPDDHVRHGCNLTPNIAARVVTRYLQSALR